MLFGKDAAEDYVVLNYLQSRIMFSTGGLVGQRDARLTRAAVTRPFRSAFGQEIYGDTFAKAAALMDSIANRVVFHDGNKRTALLAAALYLRRNNEVLRFGRYEGEAFMGYVVLEHPPIEEIADWLRSHTIGHELPA